ncbi:MAG TPA: DUF2844 domain-containing protein [Steroidobacteraceae bacterium]|jgi:hypothetical protein|nr:DUF2844 domain-containing protein [Steroidobacteraceae bacterium]
MRLKPQLLGPALAILLWQAPAFAALGGDVRSVNADRAMMHGQLQTTSMQQYDLHEITTSGGTLIREYVTPHGQVFAVTWRGPFPPNLQQLFGSYYKQYQSAAASNATLGMHRIFSVTQSDFVAQALGRMRAYHGKAYVPSLVPSGVFLAALQ